LSVAVCNFNFFKKTQNSIPSAGDGPQLGSGGLDYSVYFKFTLVELITEYIIIIITIVTNSSTLCCPVNDIGVQAATKQRALKTVRMKK